MRHLALLLVLVGLAALGSACSNTGVAGIPALHNTASPSGGLAPEPKSVRIREFADLPQYAGYYSPAAITTGPDGNLWATDTIDQDFGENAVVAIATSGAAVHTYYFQPYGTQGSDLLDITAGPDGALWITDEYNEQIVKMTTQGQFTSYPLSGYTAPWSICVGADKALWFTATMLGGAGAIGRITTSGHVTLYSVTARTSDITAGPDGALWFTELQTSQIGRITTHGKVTMFSHGITSAPYSITAGPDGALWFTEPAGGRIGRITTNGRVTEYSKGITPTEEPYDITSGPDGALWFTEYEEHGSSYQIHASKIGRITTTGAISEYSRHLNPGSAPTTITTGPDKKLWFVETTADRTGRLRP